MAVRDKEFSRMEEIANTITIYEKEADAIKDQARKILTSHYYIPFDKGEILSILTAQDGIADICQDVAKLYTLRNMEVPKELENDFDEFSKVVISVARKGVDTVKKLNNLFEVGFKGDEVEDVITIIKELEIAEDKADEVGIRFTKKIITLEGKESPIAIYMWMRIIKVMGDLANISEKLSNRFRLLLN